jgi:hypothetical protein
LQKAYGNYYVEEGRSADGRVLEIGYRNKVTGILWSTGACVGQKERRGDLAFAVELLHYNSSQKLALLERLNWKLFDTLPYSTDIAPSVCDPCNNNETVTGG